MDWSFTLGERTTTNRSSIGFKRFWGLFWREFLKGGWRD